MERFCTIGNMFVIERTGKTFSGPLVASAQAVHAIVEHDVGKSELNSGMRGPAQIMSMASGLVQAIPVPGLGQFDTSMDELIAAFGNDDQWPVPLVGERAFVFPRDRIERLKHRLMTGLSFRVDGIPVTIYAKRQQRIDGNAFLKAHGWPLDDRGLKERLFGKKAG
jgi:hypothetical protein